VKKNVRVTEGGNIMVKVGLIRDEPFEILFQKIVKADACYFIVKPCRLYYDKQKCEFGYEFYDGVFLDKSEIEDLIYGLVQMISERVKAE